MFYLSALERHSEGHTTPSRKEIWAWFGLFQNTKIKTFDMHSVPKVKMKKTEGNKLDLRHQEQKEVSPTLLLPSKTRFCKKDVHTEPWVTSVHEMPAAPHPALSVPASFSDCNPGAGAC